MTKVIELKPYITFIRGEYKAIEEDEFLEAHPELQRIMDYLLVRQNDHFDKETAKLLELMEREQKKNERCQ